MNKRTLVLAGTHYAYQRTVQDLGLDPKLCAYVSCSDRVRGYNSSGADYVIGYGAHRHEAYYRALEYMRDFQQMECRADLRRQEERERAEAMRRMQAAERAPASADTNAPTWAPKLTTGRQPRGEK